MQAPTRADHSYDAQFCPSPKSVLSCSSASSPNAYERGSVLVTTNLDFASWTDVFGDARLTGALLDRLTHRCHIIEFQGDSYRFKEPAPQSQDQRLTSRQQKTRPATTPKVSAFSFIALGPFSIDKHKRAWVLIDTLSHDT